MKAYSNITIHPPFALNEIGKRSNNEDSIYPEKGKATEANRLFLVCDGVGGTNRGEVASKLICTHLPLFYRDRFSQNVQIDKGQIISGIRHVESKFQEHLKEYPECQGMASTITMLLIGNDGCYAAWAGDSRIYQFRQGKIIFRSKDHSLVSELVESGEIAAHEAENHPLKNRITRAINGEEPVDMEVVKLTDLMLDDTFLLCSDGIMESLNDTQISSLLSENRHSNKNTVDAIHQTALLKSRDNFSLYMIQLAGLELEQTPDEELTYPMEAPEINTTSGRGILSRLNRLFKYGKL